MGPTGSGKTTVSTRSSISLELMLTTKSNQFINLASGSGLRVGNGLESCTSDVQTSQAFLVDGRYVRLVDTPGFDDTTKSDTDVLKLIAAFLATTCAFDIIPSPSLLKRQPPAGMKPVVNWPV
jgi:hypothetical protein